MAKKLKVKVKINKIYIPIPAVPLSLAARIIKFGIKHSTPEETNKNIHPKEIDRFINILKNTEPFILADIDAEDNGRKVSVKIFTK